MGGTVPRNGWVRRPRERIKRCDESGPSLLELDAQIGTHAVREFAPRPLLDDPTPPGHLVGVVGDLVPPPVREPDEGSISVDLYLSCPDKRAHHLADLLHRPPELV